MKIKCQMTHIRKNLNCNELHGNELGLSKIDSVSERLLSTIKKCNISFNLSIVKKNYIPLALLSILFLILAIIKLLRGLFTTNLNSEEY